MDVKLRRRKPVFPLPESLSISICLSIFVVILALTAHYHPDISRIFTGASSDEKEGSNFSLNIAILATFGTFCQILAPFIYRIFSQKPEYSGYGMKDVLNEAGSALAKELRLFKKQEVTDGVHNYKEQFDKFGRVYRASKQVDLDILKTIETQPIYSRIGMGSLMFIALAALVGLAAFFFGIDYMASNISKIKAQNLCIAIVFYFAMISMITFIYRPIRDARSIRYFRSAALSYLRVKRYSHDEIFYSRLVNIRLGLLKANKKNPSCLHESWPAAAALDIQALNAKYMSLAVFAWVLPVCGFIGTAVGLRQAVQAFKSVIEAGTQIDTNALATNVLPALAEAFQSTIEALIATVAVYVCSATLKWVERNNIERLDRECLLVLSAIRLPNSGDTNDEMFSAINELSSEIKNLSRSLTKYNDGFIDDSEESEVQPPFSPGPREQ